MTTAEAIAHCKGYLPDTDIRKFIIKVLEEYGGKEKEGGSVKVSSPCNKDCFNPYESYGEICVGCGCCSSDKLTRYKARYELAKRMLREQLHFDKWSDDEALVKIQEDNMLQNIHYFESLIKRCEKLIKEVEEGVV